MLEARSGLRISRRLPWRANKSIVQSESPTSIRSVICVGRIDGVPTVCLFSVTVQMNFVFGHGGPPSDAHATTRTALGLKSSLTRCNVVNPARTAEKIFHAKHRSTCKPEQRNNRKGRKDEYERYSYPPFVFFHDCPEHSPLSLH